MERFWGKWQPKNTSEKRTSHRLRWDRIRDRLSRDSSASARLPRGLPTGLSSAACGVWYVLALVVVVSVVVVVLGALRWGISTRVLYLSFLSLSLSLSLSRKESSESSSRWKLTAVFSFLQTGETIAEAGKEALKTIGVIKTPT